MKIKTKVFKYALLMMWMAIAFWACAEDKETEIEIEKIPVKTIVAEWKDVAIPIHTSGLIKSSKESNLSFKIGGIISNIPVAAGQIVKKGQLLAKLSPTEINARVLQAKEGFKKARRDFERVKKLYADSVVTREQLQNLQTALDIAKADLKIAKFNQQYAAIYAPSAGIILSTRGEENELVQAGYPVIRFAGKTNDFEVIVGVSSQNILKIMPGDRAEVSFENYPGKIFPATVIESGGGLDPMSATFQAKIQLEESDTRLISGMVGSVKIMPSELMTVVLLPAESIIEANGTLAAVFIIDQDNIARRRNIEIEQMMEKAVAIKTGLKSGEIVATIGAAYLTDGKHVMIKE